MMSSIAKLVRARELLLNLALKELKVRYKSAVLGFFWSILQPLLMMIIFAVIFGIFLNLKSKMDVPYPAFLIVGLFPWYFFSSSFSAATNAIVDNANLVKKVYFPRQVLPLSIILSNLANFLLSLVVLFVFIFLIYRMDLTWNLLYLPVIILLQLVFITGLCMITGSLNVYYRDVKYIVEILLTVWFYATPIFYSMQMVPKMIKPLFYLNPMATLITMYREILLEGSRPDVASFVTAIIISFALLKIGIVISDKYEYVFADYV
jgi:lipopolysaccharide transport system permease protein